MGMASLKASVKAKQINRFHKRKPWEGSKSPIMTEKKQKTWPQKRLSCVEKKARTRKTLVSMGHEVSKTTEQKEKKPGKGRPPTVRTSFEERELSWRGVAGQGVPRRKPTQRPSKNQKFQKFFGKQRRKGKGS